ncbi:hypothetical protein AB0L86_31355 [Micromonospora musae]|uniref:hypothetical protein n=1 Tax=Micromonospora musae TaxID=1894970 RepID=UPI0034292268
MGSVLGRSWRRRSLSPPARSASPDRRPAPTWPWWPIGSLALAALTPAMFLLPPVVVAAAAALALTGIAISDAARARRNPSEPPSPPG